MPVFLTETINENCSLTIWKITESYDDLISIFDPLAEDLEKFNSIHHPVKRTECIASRMALKEILKLSGIPYKGIGYEKNRKPYLVGSGVYISFSHSGDYACALMHKTKNAAIDLEMIREKLTIVCPRILNNDELRDAGENIAKLAVYWSCKEVAYKFHAERKLSFKKNIFIEPFIFAESGECKAELKLNGIHTRFKIKYRLFGNYIIAYAYEN
jgi:4'-phosphopantetheinyl transferase